MSQSDLIEKYIQKRATAGELKKIRQLMEEDPDFKEEIILQLEIQQAIKREVLKLRLQQFEKREIKKKKIFSQLWKIAAVFVVGLSLLWFFNRSPDYGRIYAANFEPYPNIVVPSIRDFNTSENDVEEAFRYYDNQDYKKAAAAFKKLYLDDEIAYANFYYAISLMSDHKVEKALEALESSSWKIPKRYQYQTDWYLALGYLKVQNIEKATVYLQKVIKSDNPMATQAQQILMEIE